VVTIDDHHPTAHHTRLKDGIRHLRPLQRIDDQGEAVIKDLGRVKPIHGARQQWAEPGLDRPDDVGAPDSALTRDATATACHTHPGNAVGQAPLQGGLTMEHRGQSGVRSRWHARHQPPPQPLKHSIS